MVFKISLKTFSLPATTLPVSKYLSRPEKSPIKPPQRIRTTNTRGFENTLIGTGFPFKSPQHLDAYLDMFKAIHPKVAGIRRAGSAALDLACTIEWVNNPLKATVA
jgi:hypothetical protein